MFLWYCFKILIFWCLTKIFWYCFEISIFWCSLDIVFNVLPFLAEALPCSDFLVIFSRLWLPPPSWLRSTQELLRYHTPFVTLRHTLQKCNNIVIILLFPLLCYIMLHWNWPTISWYCPLFLFCLCVCVTFTFLNCKPYFKPKSLGQFLDLFIML